VYPLTKYCTTPGSYCTYILSIDAVVCNPPPPKLWLMSTSIYRWMSEWIVWQEAQKLIPRCDECPCIGDEYKNGLHVVWWSCIMHSEHSSKHLKRDLYIALPFFAESCHLQHKTVSQTDLKGYEYYSRCVHAAPIESSSAKKVWKSWPSQWRWQGTTNSCESGK
jgi:hypothetical protein